MSLRAKRSNLLINQKETMKRLVVLIKGLAEDVIDLFFIFVRRNEPTIPFERVIAELKQVVK
jgi:hypothetical protein